MQPLAREFVHAGHGEFVGVEGDLRFGVNGRECVCRGGGIEE